MHQREIQLVVLGKGRIAVVATILMYFAAFFFAPVVAYSESVVIPENYREGYVACTGGGYVNFTSLTASEQACLERYLYPPSVLTGFATPAYRLAGFGQAPFSRIAVVAAGNASALLFFEGSQLVSAERVPLPSVELNPARVAEVDKAPVVASDYGFINITIEVRNVGYENITGSGVYLSMAGYSKNATVDGLTWIEPRLVGTCGAIWHPSQFCTVTQVVENRLPANQSFSYYVEVRGEHGGEYFVHRQGFGEQYPRGGIGPVWVSRFIGDIDSTRGGPALVEDSALDEFAAIRFADASLHFQISDYGFDEDYARFFGPNGTGPHVEEFLLYPGPETPSGYAEFLATHAPTHWQGITNLNFTHYGYFAGSSAYYQVYLPCSVYEIPRPGINITQYFRDNGCKSLVQPGIPWLVLILSD